MPPPRPSGGVGGATPVGGVPAVVLVGGMPGDEGGMPADEGGMPGDEGGIPAVEGGMPGAEGGMPADEGGMPMVVGVVEPEFGRVSPSGSSGGIGLPGEVMDGFVLVLLPLVGFDAVVGIDPVAWPNPLDAADIPAMAPDIAVLMLLPGSPIPGRIMPVISPPLAEPMLGILGFDDIDGMSPGPLVPVPDVPPEAPPEVDAMLPPPEPQFPLDPLNEPL